jgi:hypothetical protein
VDLSNPQLTSLAQFPAMTALTIHTSLIRLGDCEALLDSLNPNNRLTSLTLYITLPRFSPPSLTVRGLAAACMKISCTIAVRVLRVSNDQRALDAEAAIWTAFADVDAQGRLQIMAQLTNREA